MHANEVLRILTLENNFLGEGLKNNLKRSNIMQPQHFKILSH